ncbi:hypothetical protein IR083_07160 [Dysgonomonas sp. GY75]|uniref:DUF6549 family protein n=1 Tax=Dysgonomonas sp. GY75 TaxID=2780419 RepID=UPI0018831919|nr:DUF6549 family protein [Dysgonomonas sp. GY75]MBF0648593.1 hypothetical protein [Dysgonomonas sp. GY75]
MNRILVILIAVILLLGGGITALYKYTVHLKGERDTYKSNTSALLSGVKRMQSDSATMALDVKTLRLTLDEYKQYRATDAAHMEKLGIELKRLKAVSKHEVEVNADIKAEIRDTAVVRDTVTLVLKKIELNTPYLQVRGIIENNELVGKIRLPVTLRQAVWLEPKHRFLWWKWGVKAVHQTISCDNPHVEIKYSEIIMIDK